MTLIHRSTGSLRSRVLLALLTRKKFGLFSDKIDFWFPLNQICNFEVSQTIKKIQGKDQHWPHFQLKLSIFPSLGQYLLEKIKILIIFRVRANLLMKYSGSYLVSRDLQLVKKFSMHVWNLNKVGIFIKSAGRQAKAPRALIGII